MKACVICDSPKRSEIDQARIGGASIRQLARQYGRSTNTIQRHIEHIHDAARRAQDVAEARDAAHGASTLDELEDLCAIGRRLLDKAEKKKDYRTAIAGLRELVRLAEVKARVTGDDPSTNAGQIAGETLARMAEVFLERRRVQTSALPLSAGYQPPTASDAPVSSEGTD